MGDYKCLDLSTALYQLDYCESMNGHGARGALFEIKLPDWGYTIAAKVTGIECVDDLKHESDVYHRLRPL